MDKLTTDQRARILHLLCEGMSIRAVVRLTGASKNTVAKLLNDAGQALGAYQDQAFRNLSCKRVQVDEIWSFCYAKADNLAKAKAAPAEAGDVWTWTAIDADTKLVFSVLIGRRDASYAREFMDDIKARVTGRMQLTSDGHRAYLSAVQGAFKGEVDFAQLVKLYGPAMDAGRYSPPECTGARKSIVTGNPDLAHVSTSYAERQNLTMRMHMRRFARLTNAFSRKIEMHAHNVALHSMYYNFCKIHQTLRVTPAMQAGLSDHAWEISELVSLLSSSTEQLTA